MCACVRECDAGGCFFFKQKTAYEMHISDWSSDVCSADLSICSDSYRLDGRLGSWSLDGNVEDVAGLVCPEPIRFRCARIPGAICHLKLAVPVAESQVVKPGPHIAIHRNRVRRLAGFKQKLPH